MASRTELLNITIGSSHPKIGFLKAVSAQEEIAYKLCKRYKKNVSYFDSGADTARAQFKRLNKVQEFWFDKVCEEVLLLRQELKDVKVELQVNMMQ